jgi:hypothetical protein
MAKAHSKKGSPAGKRATKVDDKSVVEGGLKADRKTKTREVAASVKVSPGLRKQVRRLERQLADAAREELKRVRKLEKAHHRLQRAEAALNELRTVSAASVPAATQTDAPVTKAAPASAPAATKSAARTRAAAPKAAPKAKAKPEPAAAEPTQDVAPES